MAQLLGTLTILSGQTSSAQLDVLGIGSAGVAKTAFATLLDLIVFGPTTLPEAVNIQVSWLEAPTASDWSDLYIAGSKVVIPAGGAASIPSGAFRAIRVLAGGAVGADRTFKVMAQQQLNALI